MVDRTDITPEFVRQLIRFDKDSGKYYWLPRDGRFFKNPIYANQWNSKNAGKEVFVFDADGYRHTSIFRLRMKAHRLIWAHHYGEWPDGHIDHINGNRSDNRIENLRVVSVAENNRNTALPKSNTSGVIGVSFHKLTKKWRARITFNYKEINLGLFATKDAAVRARKAAEKHFGFHPNHGRKK